MSRDSVTSWGEIFFFSNKASRPYLRITKMSVRGALSLADKVAGA